MAVYLHRHNIWTSQKQSDLEGLMDFEILVRVRLNWRKPTVPEDIGSNDYIILLYM